jgi:hypothetical protein
MAKPFPYVSNVAELADSACHYLLALVSRSLTHPSL